MMKGTLGTNKFRSNTRRKVLPASLVGVVLLSATVLGFLFADTEPSMTFNHATYSSPIALSADNKLVWSVNPADNSVSILRTDTNTLIKNIKVDTEPQGIALDPGNKFAYVANAASNDVTVIKIIDADPNTFNAEVDSSAGNKGNITTGAEPWNIVVSPDGKRIFVANSGQDTITVINANNRKIIGQVNLRNSLCNDPDRNRHFQPRGLAVTKASTKLYVTRFLSFTQTGGVQGVDTGREGVVCRLDINTNAEGIGDYRAAAVIRLEPRVTGFQFPGLNEDTLAFPNQLQSIVIRGNQAYLPNIAASPSDPLRFNVDTQAFVNIIDNVNESSQTDASLSKFFLGNENIGPNLHLGARVPETGKKTLFFANPWGIAFTNQNGSGEAYVVGAGSDLLVKVNVAADGTISFTSGQANQTRYIDLNDPADPSTSGVNAGKNPTGIVINDAGTTAYVVNFVSRNVSVVDLVADRVSKVIKTTDLPTPGSPQEVVLVGAEMFFSSRGHFDQPPGTTISTNERLAQTGWQACSSCHFKGLTDSVVWRFNTGPRKSVPLNGTFNPNHNDTDESNQRVLNYSAIFDEIHDFELNIRNVSGPGALATAEPCSAPPPATSTFDPNHGLLLGDTNAELAPCTIVAFQKPNENRNEITVTLPGSVPVKALSALNEWVKLAIRTPNSPLDSNHLDGGVPIHDILAGGILFKAAGCATCHGGDQWTSSIREFTPPPGPGDIFCEVDAGATAPPGCQKAPVTGNPVNAQYLDHFLRDINSFGLNVAGSGNAIPGQPLIGAVEKATRVVVNGVLQAEPQDALGKDFNEDDHGNGFSPPSLLGIYALPPYYHNGACETLACVLADVNHRTGNHQFTDILGDPHQQALVVRFLESIDARSTPIE